MACSKEISHEYNTFILVSLKIVIEITFTAYLLYFHQPTYFTCNKISFVKFVTVRNIPISVFSIVAKLISHWSDISSTVHQSFFALIYFLFHKNFSMTQYCKLFSSVSILMIFVFVIGTVNSDNVTDGNLNVWSSLLEQYTIE